MSAFIQPYGLLCIYVSLCKSNSPKGSGGWSLLERAQWKCSYCIPLGRVAQSGTHFLPRHQIRDPPKKQRGTFTWQECECQLWRQSTIWNVALGYCIFNRWECSTQLGPCFYENRYEGGWKTSPKSPNLWNVNEGGGESKNPKFMRMYLKCRPKYRVSQS